MGTVAIYIFDSHADAQDAMDRLYLNMSSGGFSKVGNEVHIEFACSDHDLASRICRSCGGSRR